MAGIAITKVRHEGADADSRLDGYVFGNKYGPPRPPRGIDPGQVSQYLREHLKPDSPPSAYQRAGELMRFYERSDIVPVLFLVLNAREADAGDVRRSLHAIQAIGDLGTPDETARAAEYFDRRIVPHSAVDEKLFPLLIDTLIPLAPAGSADKLAKRLADDVTGTVPADPKSRGPEGLAHRSFVDLQKNYLPGTLGQVAGKKKLLIQPPTARRRELAQVYLDESDISDSAMDVWAGRLLRQDAMEGAAEEVYAELRRAMGAAGPPGKRDADFLVVRAAQALIYLSGPLTALEQTRYEAAKDGAANFLWDDPGS